MLSPKWSRFGTEMGPEWSPEGGLERPEALPSPPETPLRLEIDFGIDFGSILGALLALCWDHLGLPSARKCLLAPFEEREVEEHALQRLPTSIFY